MRRAIMRREVKPALSANGVLGVREKAGSLLNPEGKKSRHTHTQLLRGKDHLVHWGKDPYSTFTYPNGPPASASPLPFALAH